MVVHAALSTPSPASTSVVVEPDVAFPLNQRDEGSAVLSTEQSVPTAAKMFCVAGRTYQVSEIISYDCKVKKE